MTFNNSVLLIIKQSPGIDYNELFTRISTRYKNPASAKSALARAIKDLVSFGLLKKEGTKLFVTDKGLASMNLEMKDKLVLRLNEEMKHPLTSLDDIVRLLVVLSQRGSQDRDLLNNAKENASFSIKDIDELRGKIRAQRKYLKKMSLLLATQADKLKELDFNDSFSLPFDSSFAQKVTLFCAGRKIIAETKDPDVLSKSPEHWKKQGTISVEGENVALLLQLLSSIPSAKAILYMPGLRINLMAGKANCFGSFKTIKTFLETKLSIAAITKEETPSQQNLQTKS